MSQVPDHSNRIAPEYWADHDIFDAELFKEAPYVPGIYLEYAKFQYARERLQYGVGQVAAGNATEIRYRAGSEFNPDLEDGSLVITDTEHLSRWTYADPKRGWEDSGRHDEGPVINRPYSDFWLRNQDGNPNPNPNLGAEVTIFFDQLAIYTRLLHWGVIVSQGKDRLIQPFFFSTTKLLPGGYIHTPRALRKDSALHGQTIKLPISVGEVKVKPRLIVEEHGYAIDALERVRSVDVVYPASGGREPRTSRKRGLGRLALPKLGSNHA